MRAGGLGLQAGKVLGASQQRRTCTIFFFFFFYYLWRSLGDRSPITSVRSFSKIRVNFLNGRRLPRRPASSRRGDERRVFGTLARVARSHVDQAAEEGRARPRTSACRERRRRTGVTALMRLEPRSARCRRRGAGRDWGRSACINSTRPFRWGH